MKIARTIVGECGSGPTCPEVHVLDDGRWLVRGDKLGRHGPAGALRRLLRLPGHEDAVLLPADVIRQVKEDPSQC